MFIPITNTRMENNIQPVSTASQIISYATLGLSDNL